MWTEECPTRPGEYWFYGWPIKRGKEHGDKPTLRRLTVREIVGGELTYHTLVGLVYPEHVAGWFCEANIPPLPVVAPDALV